MKRLFLIVFVLAGYYARAMEKDSTIQYLLPDSVKAFQFYAEINVKSHSQKKESFGGIMTDKVKLSLEADKGEKELVFEFPKSATVFASGIGTEKDEKGEISIKYDWSINETYKLLIASASDSAGNFSIYSGYFWLPGENKWKFIGSCRINGTYDLIKQPALFFTSGKNNSMVIEPGQVWCQRTNSSWKNLKEAGSVPPLINLFGHLDSVAQRKVDVAIIEKTFPDAKNKEGVYYHILNEGSGRQVDLHDTVTVFYKVTLLNDTAVIDQAKDKPATFPLQRLIRGWQIGVPLLKVGGKIRLYLPSDLGYSIRTRSAKIPPNSILVFDIEVMDAKAPDK